MTSTIHPITTADVRNLDDEPRVRDLRLAEALGYDRPRIIRDLIARNIAEIETLGPSPRRAAMVEIGSGAKREVTEYWLNEAQALLVCMFARTERAAEARKQVIEVFMAWRRGLHWPARPSGNVSTPAPQAKKPEPKSALDLSFVKTSGGGIVVELEKANLKCQGMTPHQTGRALCAEVIDLARQNPVEGHMLMTIIPQELIKMEMTEHARGFVSKLATWVIYGIDLENRVFSGRPGRYPRVNED